MESIQNFWAIFDVLEAENDIGKIISRYNGKIISHIELHEALVHSGRFYQGDATQIISDMVEAGWRRFHLSDTRQIIKMKKGRV